MKKITVRRMAEECGFSVLAGADALDREADRVFCCDLLSFVMGRAPADSAWVTVMGNVQCGGGRRSGGYCLYRSGGKRTLGRGSPFPADGQGVPVLGSPHPVFDTGLLIPAVAGGLTGCHTPPGRISSGGVCFLDWKGGNGVKKVVYDLHTHSALSPLRGQ